MNEEHKGNIAIPVLIFLLVGSLLFAAWAFLSHIIRSIDDPVERGLFYVAVAIFLCGGCRCASSSSKE